jgi:hypothetical protein
MLLPVALTLFVLTSCSGVNFGHKFRTETYDAQMVNVMGSGSFQKTGCWARFYDEASFNGESLLIHTGQSLRSLKFDDIEDWRGRIRSFELGPHSEVRLYRSENFSYPILIAGVSQRFRGASGQSLDHVRSIKLSCLKDSAIRNKTLRELAP